MVGTALHRRGMYSAASARVSIRNDMNAKTLFGILTMHSSGPTGHSFQIAPGLLKTLDWQLKHMKPIKLLLMSAALAMVALGPRAQANQNLGSPGIKQYLPLVFEFPTTGPKEPPFPDPTWIYWYNTPGGNTPITTDPTTGLANPTPGSNTSSLGSLKIVTPWPASGASQDVFFGCFDDGSPYDFTELADLTTYRNISFSILVQPGTALNGSGNYGAINAGFCDTSYGWQQAGSVTIPAAAAYSWQRLTVPIVQSQVGAGLNRYEPDIAFQYDNWGGYPAAGTT